MRNSIIISDKTDTINISLLIQHLTSLQKQLNAMQDGFGKDPNYVVKLKEILFEISWRSHEISWKKKYSCLDKLSEADWQVLDKLSAYLASNEYCKAGLSEFELLSFIGVLRSGTCALTQKFKKIFCLTEYRGTVVILAKSSQIEKIIAKL